MEPALAVADLLVLADLPDFPDLAELADLVDLGALTPGLLWPASELPAAWAAGAKAEAANTKVTAASIARQRVA